MLSPSQKNQLIQKYENLVWVSKNKNTWIFTDSFFQERLSGIEDKIEFSIIENECDFGNEKAHLIKQNPVRQVFQGNDFFYKRTFKDDNTLFLEFQRTLDMNKVGIPCVKCAALGYTQEGVFLVTQAQKDTVQLDKYLEKNSLDEKMLASFKNFILNLLAHKISHDDFHLGNILYNPIENNFYLVDVLKCKTSKVSLWYNWFAKKKIVRIFCLLRDKLQLFTIEKCLLACKIATPKIFYNSQIKGEVKRIFKEWPKRKKQVLSGYEKFTKKDGDELILSIAKMDDFQDAKIVSGNASYLVADIFLSLMRIPHIRVLKVNLATNKVWLANFTGFDLNDVEAMVEYQNRLEDILPIKTSQEDWSSSDIYPVVFTGYEKIVNLPLFKVE